jgi:hypothetical protein
MEENMLKSCGKFTMAAIIGLTAFAWSSGPAAANAINGSFETGDYTGWTLQKKGPAPTAGTWAIIQNDEVIRRFQEIFDHADSTNIRQDAPILPVSFPVSDGAFAALNLQNMPLSSRMSQEITLPANATALSWDMAYRNFAGEFSGQQYLAVHLRDSADVVLKTLYITGSESPMDQSMSTFAADVSQFAGESVRVDVDINVGLYYFPVALDNFRVETVEVETLTLPALPPGWAKGKKTGWQGELPPGLERQNRTVPGLENRQK